MKLFLTVAPTLLLAVGCGGDPAPEQDAGIPDSGEPDGGQPDSGPEECLGFEPWEAGDDGAEDLTLPPTDGGAVAGRITEEGQLLDGLKPRGRVGDFLLANDRIALIIEDARPSDGYGTGGGEILDADLVGPDGPLGESLFNEMLVGILAEVLDAEQVSVMSDGSDGEAAVIRATGHLAPVWLLEECCSFLFPRFLRMPVSIEYTLEPDAEAVAIRLSVRNDTTLVEMAASFLTVMIGGDGMVRYAPGVGFDEGADFGTQRYLGFVGENIAYAWVVEPGRSLAFMLAESGVHIYQSPGDILPACEEAVFDLGHFVVAAGSPTEMVAAIGRLEGESPLAALVGSVTEADGTPLPGARVHVTDTEGAYLSMGRADDEGNYRVELPPGTAQVQAWSTYRWPTESESVTIGDGDETLDLVFEPVGTLSWVVHDGEGTEIPAKVSIVAPDRDSPVAPASFGEPTHPYGALVHEFALPGMQEIQLPAGTYRVVASRGYEYEIDEVEVEVTAGETSEATLTLVRSVDTTDWLCGDFHIHTMYSPDSNDFAEWKVAASVAMGLELPVSTDHRYVSDLQPVAERLELGEWVHWFPGHEITTVVYGHFNAYPLEVRLDEPNQGAIDWLGMDPGELFQTVRDYPGDPILQVNHPRSGGAIGAYFEYAQLDPDTFEMGRPEGWSDNFDAIEVFNGSDWIGNRDDTVRDWFAMLNQRYTVTATGNSDSHSAEWSDVGYPRNYLFLETDSPDEVTEEMLRDTVREGRYVIGGGLFVTVETEAGVLPGGVADASGGDTGIHIRIQAPSWMDAENAVVIVDGVIVETIELDETTEDPDNPVIRLDRIIELDLAADAWMVVAAWSEGSLDPVTRSKRPFGVTNPIYFDVDGDGEYADSGR